jgi:hypothetical protein
MLLKFTTFEGILSLLNTLALAFLVGKLLRNSLHQTYRALFWFLVAQVLASAVLLSLPVRSNVYAWTYLTAETIIIVLAIFVVHELYLLALAPHPALSAAGRKAILYIFPTTFVIALLSTAIDATVLPSQSQIVHRFFTVERVVDVAIFLFLILIGGLMLWFPLVMRRNIMLYVGGFIVYFVARACGLLLANILPPSAIQQVSNTLMGVTFACLIFWIVALRRENEERMSVTGHRWDPGAMAHLSEQLSAINTALARLIRQS